MTTTLRFVSGLGGSMAVCALLALIAGCDGPAITPTPDGGARPDTGTGDGGRMLDGGRADGGPCAGRALCAAAGTRCEGDARITCAPDVDGCLVETSEDCAAVVGGSCEAPMGGDAMCVVDPCAAIPAGERCTMLERRCDGDTLTECQPNADACLVITTTDCAAAGGVCDASGAMAMCALPADPCEAIPAAMRCDAVGTSCTDATTLERCAPDAFGCLVRTPTSCAMRAGGTCDATSFPAACVFTGDPCAGVTQCADRGSVRCDGPALVRCARDAFGCFVETRTTCTDAPFGFCDADATPNVCSTAATDPCMGVAECSPVGRACDADTLRVCAPNAFGCDVETPIDCTTDGDVCSAASGTAACVDPCSLVTLCPMAELCSGNAAIHCAPDANGCLVEASRDTCAAAEVCEVGGSGATCVTDALCAAAERTVLTCATGMISGDTAGGSTVLGPYHPSCGPAPLDGAERIYRFRHTGSERVEVTVRTVAAMYDYDLFVLSTAGDTLACDATAACVDTSLSGTGTETVVFGADPGQTFYVVEDLYGTPIDRTSTFTLEVTCAPVTCGDGVVAASEGCDDMNTDPMDGCAPDCTVEPGYACTGTPSICTVTCGNGVIDASETCDDGARVPMDGCSATCAIEPGYNCSGAPSVCVAIAPNATCASAASVTVTSTVMADTRAGTAPGALPASCGTASGPALWYSVTVPPMSTVALRASAAFDLTLHARGACADAACVALADTPGTGPETLVLRNTTGAPITRLVAVQGFFGSGPVTLAWSTPTCGNGVIEPGEACDDMNTIGTDGCTAACTVDLGYSCAGEPSVCTRLAAISPIAAACVDTTSGMSLAAIGDDAATPIAALPFAFALQGAAVTHYSVTSNGFLQLWPSMAGTPSTAYINAPIPSVAPPNGMIAAFWDDLVPGASGTLRALVTGTAPNRVLVVEWGNWGTFGDAGQDLTFQAHLRETTGVVELHYCAMMGAARATGASATIGYETLDGSAGVQISLDTAGAAATGTGYRITP